MRCLMCRRKNSSSFSISKIIFTTEALRTRSGVIFSQPVLASRLGGGDDGREKDSALTGKKKNSLCALRATVVTFLNRETDLKRLVGS